MSIFKVSAALDIQGITYTTVLANERDNYLESWLQLLGTSAYVTQTMQRFHWNVRGEQFLLIHKDLLQPLYELAFGLQDKFGEKYRALDIDNDITEAVFTKYNMIELTYLDYVSKGIYKKKLNNYLGYTLHVLKNLRNMILRVNKHAVEQDDLGGQDMLASQVAELDSWIWKVQSHLPKRKQ